MGIATVRGEFTDFEGTPEIAEDLASSRRMEPSRPPPLTPTRPSGSHTYADHETFRITGRLTLHGASNEIVLTAEGNGTDVDPYGSEKVGEEIRVSSAAATPA
jgi:polyisoprenoid-binding protein YceI